MDYLTYPVFPVVPEIPFKGGEFTLYDLVGAEYGARLFVSHTSGNNKASLTFRQENASDRKVLKDFFLNHLGKLDPFWLRSYIPKMTIIEDVGIGALVVKVKVDNLYLREHLSKMVIYDDVLPFATHVISHPLVITEELGSHSILNLSNPLLRSFKAGESLEELYFVRFDTDTLSFDQEAYGITKCGLTFVELQQELGKVGI